MEAADSQKQKKVQKYSIAGLVIGGLLILSTLGNALALFRNPKLPFLGLFITFVPGVAIIVRSLRPPISFGRGMAVVFGGLFVGKVPMTLMHAASQQLAINLFLGAVGIYLLWFGFKEPKT